MKTPSIPHTAVLTSHPETYSQAVHGIEARVWWTQGGALALTFALKGDFTRLRIPPPRPARRADGLWQHTCFEVFVSVKGHSAYHEFNFAPSGEWAAYTFRGYRDGAPLAEDEIAPRITVRGAGDSLDLDAIVRLDRLPRIQPHAALRVALSAVIEEEGGMLSYWALKHPPGKPDFHHPDAFALELEPPDGEGFKESATAEDPEAK
ncbi:MAG: DOMON-like domain-containing protein [Acidimicrobiia bacterium]